MPASRSRRRGLLGRSFLAGGELLKQIEPKQGANQNIQDGTDPKVGRTAAADAAGLSERQRKTASSDAVASCGELLKQIEPKQARTDLGTAQTRSAAADANAMFEI